MEYIGIGLLLFIGFYLAPLVIAAAILGITAVFAVIFWAIDKLFN